MKILGNKPTNDLEYLNQNTKDIIVANNKPKYFKNVTFSTKKTIKNTISTGLYRPDRFSEAKESVLFNHRGIIEPVIKLGSHFIEEKEVPRIRFRVKDKANRIHWLADFYKSNNFLMTSGAIGNPEYKEHYNEIFNILRENNLIKEDTSKGKLDEISISFKLNLFLRLYIDNKPVDTNSQLFFENIDGEDKITFKHNKEFFKKNNIKIEYIFSSRNGKPFNNTKNVLIVDANSSLMRLLPKATNSADSSYKELELTFKKYSNVDLRLNDSYIYIDIYDKNYQLKISSELKLLFDYFIFYKLARLKGYDILTQNKRYGISVNFPSVLFSDKKITRISLDITEKIIKKYYSGESIELLKGPGSSAIEKEYVKQFNMSKEDANYFLNFLSKAYSIHDKVRSLNIVTAWTDKEKDKETNPVNEVKVSFNSKDTFSEFMRTTLESLTKKLCEKTLISNDIKVNFYGLKKSRGDVISGFKSKGFTTVDANEKYKNIFNIINIGLPISIRTKRSTTNIERAIKDMLNEIKRSIERCV